ncbi:MAG: hypothetical protein ABI357_00365 [Granulicella sp.]
MNSPACCSQSDAGSDPSQIQAVPIVSAADRRSLHTTEIVYAVFALAAGILLFATAF